MMLKNIFSSLLLVSTFLSLHSQHQLSLGEALADKLVTIAVQSSGCYRGECLTLAVKNLSGKKFDLEIPAGWIFASKDSNVQDLMVTAPQILAMNPRQVQRRNLFTMCTQSGNMGPRKGEKYLAGNLAEEDLLKLARKIAEGNYQNSTSQSAVWAVANGESVSQIYGVDTTMVRDIAGTVSEITGTPIEAFFLEPRVHHITSIRTSLEGLLKDYYESTTLELLDPSGEVIRTYFTNKKQEPGFFWHPLGASHTLGDSVELTVRLRSGEQTLIEKQISMGDSLSPIAPFHQQAVIIYEMEAMKSARVGVYDEDDQLYFLVMENYRLRPGLNRSTFIAQTQLPPDQKYFMKIKVDGETIGEQYLDPEAPEPVLYDKRSVRGVFRFEQKEPLEDVRLAIYDSEGRLKRVMFDIHRLNPGRKQYNYSFEHRDGPEAKFYIRLTDQSGRVLREKCVTCR